MSHQNAILLAAALILAARRLLHQQRALDLLRAELEQERTWADEFERRADAADASLAELRRHYAALLWLHDGDAMLTQAAAWRMGLRKVKRA